MMNEARNVDFTMNEARNNDITMNEAGNVSSTRLLSPLLAGIAWQTMAITHSDDLSKSEAVDSFMVSEE
jgi:hypothetical protein